MYYQWYLTGVFVVFVPLLLDLALSRDDTDPKLSDLSSEGKEHVLKQIKTNDDKTHLFLFEGRCGCQCMGVCHVNCLIVVFIGSFLALESPPFGKREFVALPFIVTRVMFVVICLRSGRGSWLLYFSLTCYIYTGGRSCLLLLIS